MYVHSWPALQLSSSLAILHGITPLYSSIAYGQSGQAQLSATIPVLHSKRCAAAPLLMGGGNNAKISFFFSRHFYAYSTRLVTLPKSA